MQSIPSAEFNYQGHHDNACQPLWDANRRELRFDGLTVKRYRVQAPNQEIVLAVFQELGWPACIDDPIPPDGDKDPKERLQATIKSLNRCQRPPFIRFHGNGTASQICWEIIARRPRRQRRSQQPVGC